MASYFAFAETIVSWLTRHDAAPDAARSYVGAILRGMAHTAALSPEQSFAALTTEHVTPGGINEQVLNRLTGRGMFSELSESLDAVLQRFNAMAL
jgi:pyrroline-5-carboxylate reductase